MSRQELRTNDRAPFTCAAHPSNNTPRRTIDARAFALGLILLTLTVYMAGIVRGLL